MKVNELLKKSPKHFKIDNLKKEDLLPLYERLKELGYTEKNVYERLGVPDIEFIMFKYLPIYMNKRLNENTGLDKLIKMFLLNQFLTKQEAVQVFSPDMLRFCADIGILGFDAEGFYSRVDLFPCMDGFFASDHRFTTIYGPGHVYPPGLDSYSLARGMIREKVRFTLDLCTGTGIQAILASRFSDMVTGIDINPRSINFAKFNALLNQVDNVNFIEGNLYEPVGDDKFDLILANPPFVPAPRQKVCFRDGEKSGEVILERMIGGIPEHLEDGGYAQIVTLLMFNRGEEYTDKIHRWLKDAPYNVLVMANRYKDIETYISAHVHMGKDFDEYSNELIDWFETYQANDIYKLADGIISLKKSLSGKFAGYLREIHPMRRTFSDEIKLFLDTLSKGDDEEYIKSLLEKEFVITDDVDFWWGGMNRDGMNNYGVLFRNEALFVDEKLDENCEKILDAIVSGKVKGNEILEEVRARNTGEAEFDIKAFGECMLDLIRNGVIIVK